MSAKDSIPDGQATADPVVRDERRALTLLLEDRLPWSIAELGHELGEDAEDGEVADAIAALAGSGLIHRIGDFVFPSRAARHWNVEALG